MVATNPDRPFAEVRPLYEAWAVVAVAEVATPLEWAFDRAGIPIRYIAGLSQAHGIASDQLGLALALLPGELEHATPTARVAPLRACVARWEEDGHYEACARVWCALAAWAGRERDDAG